MVKNGGFGGPAEMYAFLHYVMPQDLIRNTSVEAPVEAVVVTADMLSWKLSFELMRPPPPQPAAGQGEGGEPQPARERIYFFRWYNRYWHLQPIARAVRGQPPPQHPPVLHLRPPRRAPTDEEEQNDEDEGGGSGDEGGGGRRKRRRSQRSAYAGTNPQQHNSMAAATGMVSNHLPQAPCPVQTRLERQLFDELSVSYGINYADMADRWNTIVVDVSGGV